MSSVSVMEKFLEEAEAARQGPQVAFWTLDMEDEETLLRWLVQDVEALEEQSTERTLIQRKNLAAYRGIHYNAQDTRTREQDTIGAKGKNPRVVMNHMLDMVEQSVARITKYPAAVHATPASEDYQDKITAEIAEDLITAKWDQVQINNFMQRMHRRKKIFGEDFIVATWDKHLGELHPDWIAEVFAANGIKADPRKMTKGQIRDAMAKVKKYPSIPVVDPQTDEPILGTNGEPLKIDRPVRVGDISYKLYLSWNVLLQRRERYEDVDHAYFVDLEDVDSLKADFPHAASKLNRGTSQTNPSHFDTETLQEVPNGNRVKIYRFYHRGTRHLDQGREIWFTKDAVLLNRPNPYRGPNGVRIPCRRLVDIDAPGLLNGEATVTQGRPAQAVYNNVTSLLVRDLFLFAHPKWFVPRGSVKLESLGNGTAIAQYTGAVPPTLSQPAPANAGHYTMRAEAKRDLEQIMGVFGVSRGEPPPGISAGIALTFLEEQENERNNPDVARHLELLKGLAWDTACIMSDFYDDDDGRLESLLGKSRAHEIKDFKLSDLASVSDFRVTTGSALPQQKSARLQYIIEMKERFPNLMNDQQVIELLDLGEVEKFKNIATTAVRAADAENDGLTRGGSVTEPKRWEDHLAHYRIHMRLMNEPGFEYLPGEAQKRVEEHAMAHEMFMWEAGQKVPAYLQAIMTEFPQFPVFFVPEPAAPMLPAEVPMTLAPQAGAPMPGAGAAPVGGQMPEQMDQLPPGLTEQSPEPEPQTLQENPPL